MIDITEILGMRSRDPDHEGCVHHLPVEILIDANAEINRLRAENAELRALASPHIPLDGLLNRIMALRAAAQKFRDVMYHRVAGFDANTALEELDALLPQPEATP